MTGDDIYDILVVRKGVIMISTNDRTQRISVCCSSCAEDNTILVNAEDFLNWNSGENIYNCLPYLNSDEIVLLEYGLCSNCNWRNNNEV